MKIFDSACAFRRGLFIGRAGQTLRRCTGRAALETRPRPPRAGPLVYGSTATAAPQLCATSYNVQRTVQYKYKAVSRCSLRPPPSATPRPGHQELPSHETDHTPGRWRCACGSPTVLARPRRARLVTRAPRQAHSLVVGL